MIENIGIITKLKSFTGTPFSALKLYYALVHPHFLYAMVFWGSTFTLYLAKLSTLQNKITRPIGSGSYGDH